MAIWSSFFFNCYRHHSLIVLRNGDGKANIIHSREGGAQGGPLAMVAYGIGSLPLIKHLKLAYPDGTQPWYAGDAGAQGKFDNLKRYFNSLKRTGPARGYYPDPTKSIMIMHKKILKWEDYLARVVGLGFAWVYVILVVILGMTNP